MKKCVVCKGPIEGEGKETCGKVECIGAWAMYPDEYAPKFDEITIYSGGHHKVVCRAPGYAFVGEHFKVFENGTEERDESFSCNGWIGGCPARLIRTSRIKTIEKLSRKVEALLGLPTGGLRVENGDTKSKKLLVHYSVGGKRLIEVTAYFNTGLKSWQVGGTKDTISNHYWSELVSIGTPKLV